LIFRFINRGGRDKWNRSTPIGEAPGLPFPSEAHVQLVQGYAAAVSFVDAQVGRLLDVVDELQLWDRLTVVLTSDHGMHNGNSSGLTSLISLVVFVVNF
jgi:arylsulfatase A-like enzyme